VAGFGHDDKADVVAGCGRAPMVVGRHRHRHDGVARPVNQELADAERQPGGRRGRQVARGLAVGPSAEEAHHGIAANRLSSRGGQIGNRRQTDYSPHRQRIPDAEAAVIRQPT
jgi:hypothetical protein